jgi:hypothetical protein
VFSQPIETGAPVARRVIILEEDLQIAPDFFEFFAAMTPFIDSDDTLLGEGCLTVTMHNPTLYIDPSLVICYLILPSARVYGHVICSSRFCLER